MKNTIDDATNAEWREADKANQAAGVEVVPEQSPMQVVAAVATGSRPLWNRELSALADEWDKHAWSLKEDEVRLRGVRSPQAEQFYARWAVHRNCAEELRRKLASLNKREPVSNNSDHQRAARAQNEPNP